MTNLNWIACVFVLACASACSGSNSTTGPSATANVAYSQVELREGTGTLATSGRIVSVNYTGWLYSASAPDSKGTQFDSSYTAGRTPLSFTVFGGQVITGFSQCVSTMKVGGLRRCTLPPGLAYGAAGAPPSIPPNATLIFELELLSVQ